MVTAMPFHANIITLFPEMFPGALGYSVIGRALEQGLWSYDAINLRDFSQNKHDRVDDTPYGGGAGMLLQADTLGRAIDHAMAKKPQSRLIYLSPRGAPLSQPRVQQLAGEGALTLLCGRYEGVDQRVIDHYQIEELSVGDYVLAGGEVAAQLLLEAVIRLLPGVLGDATSACEESFSVAADENSGGLLEYPHYTKPPVWRGLEVPEVLRSGHHAQIKQWRKEQSQQLTERQRPDIWHEYLASQRILEENRGSDEPVTNN